MAEDPSSSATKTKRTGAPPPPRMPPPSGSFRGKVSAPRAPPPSVVDVQKEDGLADDVGPRSARGSSKSSVGDKPTQRAPRGPYRPGYSRDDYDQDEDYAGHRYASRRSGDYDHDHPHADPRDDMYEHEDHHYTRRSSSSRYDDHGGHYSNEEAARVEGGQYRSYRSGGSRHYDDEEDEARERAYRTGPRDDYYHPHGGDEDEHAYSHGEHGRSGGRYEEDRRRSHGSGRDGEGDRLEYKLSVHEDINDDIRANNSTSTDDHGDKTRSEKKKKKKKKSSSSADEKQNEGALEKPNRTSQSLNPRVFDTRTISTVMTELIAFLTKPFEREPGTVIRCFIERDRGLAHALSPIYTLYSDQEDGSGRMLMSARKLFKSATPYYIISISTEDLYKPRSERSSQYLGKLRGNGNATEYVLYDGGDNPDEIAASIEALELDGDSEVDFQSGKDETSRLRKELAVIWYNYGIMKDHERKVEIAIPKVAVPSDEGDPAMSESWQPVTPRDSMAESFKRIRLHGGQNVMESNRLFILHQKESRYDPLSSCLVDFKGRATAASVKNFQLMKSFPEDHEQAQTYYSNRGEGRHEERDCDGPVPILLQMGKVGRDCFNMDVQHPLSILQAFAICLSRFDTKSKWS